MICLVVIGLFVGLTLLGGFVLKLLWNWIMPYLFGLPIISIWMAIGIMILIGILFGGLKISSKSKH